MLNQSINKKIAESVELFYSLLDKGDLDSLMPPRISKFLKGTNHMFTILIVITLKGFPEILFIDEKRISIDIKHQK